MNVVRAYRPEVINRIAVPVVPLGTNQSPIMGRIESSSRGLLDHILEEITTTSNPFKTTYLIRDSGSIIPVSPKDETRKTLIRDGKEIQIYVQHSNDPSISFLIDFNINGLSEPDKKRLRAFTLGRNFDDEERKHLLSSLEGASYMIRRIKRLGEDPDYISNQFRQI